MKITNLKIDTKLKLGFAIVFALTALMGIFSWYQTHRMNEQTSYLYKHPFKVQTLIGEIKANVGIMHRDMKNLFITLDEVEFQQTILDIEQNKLITQQLIDSLYANYLGPKEDLDSVNIAFAQWNTMRDETIRLIRLGRISEAAQRTKSVGVAGGKVKQLMQHILEIDQFSLAKAANFYVNSQILHRNLNIQLTGFVLAVLMIILFVYFTLTRSIREPIFNLISATQRFKSGDYAARSDIRQKDEIGMLADSFNKLAESTEQNLLLNTALSQLSGIMSKEEEVHGFFRHTAARLLELTEAQIAAVYLADDDKHQLRLFEQIGTGEELKKQYSIEKFEGEFGLSLINNKVHHFTNLKHESGLMFHTSSSSYQPQEIITIPISMQDGLLGMLSLAKVTPFSPLAIEIINHFKDLFSARASGVVSKARIVAFGEKLAIINNDLENQRALLDKSVAYNRGLIEASIDPLVTIGPDGKITDVNKSTEDITGFSREQLIGTDFSAYFSDPLRAQLGYQQVFKDGYVRDYELELRHRDGKVTAVTYNASVYHDENGQVIGVFAAARDITEKKIAESEQKKLYEEIGQRSAYLQTANNELEVQKNELSALSAELSEQNTELEMQKKQLDEANKLKSSFLSNMSHELRTPLNSVIALSGVLSRKLKNKIGEEEFGYLEVIGKNGKNLLNLINEILDLSRIEAGKEELNLSKFSVYELVNELISIILPAGESNKVDIKNLIPVELGHIVSDRDKVRHILQNLIGNAVKFTHEGSVEIFTSYKDDKIGIHVKDTGIGIEVDKLELIFDEFRQADEKTSRRYGGSGLGLSIAKKYSELCNGSLEVTSEPGKGSDFVLYLPLNQESDQNALLHNGFMRKSQDTKPVPTALKSERTILIVEDSEPQIIQLREMIFDAGYQVMVAKDGLEALEQIKQKVPDAIILDLMMPGMDGFQVLTEIRKSFDFIIPVLILSAKHISKDELSTLQGNHISQLVQKGELNRSSLLMKIESMFEQEKLYPRVVEKSSEIKKAGQISILLIEDNFDNSTTIKALLGDKYIIITAEDGFSGYEKAVKYKPSLILLDISLPDIDGFEVLKRIRLNHEIANTPIVAVTARAMKGDRELILNYGFDGYVPKPVEQELIEQTINNLLYGK